MADTSQLDPFAAIAQPATPTPKPTPNPSTTADPFASIASSPTGAPPAKPQTSLARVTDSSKDPSILQPLTGTAAGGIKSAAGLVGNVLDFFAHPKPIGGGTPEQPTEQQQRTRQHLQDAATWLKSGGDPEGFWQNVGAIGEQVLEYLGTDGLLKVVGTGAKAAEGVSAATHTAEHLKNAQQVSTTLAKNPRLAGLLAIGLGAAKDGAMMGAQTYGHTEDAGQAAISGALGGTLRVAGEGVGAAGRYLKGVAPRTVEIAGEEIPALKTQVNEAGKPVATGAAGAPRIAEAQQQAAPKVVQNIAQDAARSSLERVNATRPVYQATSDATRMLPAPEGSEPFKFTLQGIQPVEGVTGNIAHRAQPFDPLASRVPEGGTAGAQNAEEMGSQASTIPDRLQKRTQAYTTSIRRETEGPYPSIAREAKSGKTLAERVQAMRESLGGETEPASDRVSAAGGGNLETTNPAQAEEWLRQLEEIQQNPIHRTLTSAQQEAIESQRQALSEQLGLYHASPYAQRFNPINVEDAVGQVRSFGDAADQIQASVKPVYSELDRASQGEFDKYNKAAKQALKIMRSATSMDAYQNAESNYHEATSSIENLLTRHAGNVNREDYVAAKLAWRDSARLNELHTTMERMANGITLDESDQGFTRTMTGRSKALQAYLDKGQNAEQLEQLIGKDGITNLKQLTELMARPGTQRSTVEVLKNVVSELGRHARLGGMGGFLGGAIAHTLGGSWYEGMAAGAMSGSAVRFIMHDAMTNPRIGNMVDYAVRNGVSPKVYAPLLARMIATPLESQAPSDEQETEK